MFSLHSSIKQKQSNQNLYCSYLSRIKMVRQSLSKLNDQAVIDLNKLREIFTCLINVRRNYLEL